MEGFGGLTTVPLGLSGDLTTVPMEGRGGLTTVPLTVLGDLTTVPTVSSVRQRIDFERSGNRLADAFLKQHAPSPRPRRFPAANGT